MNFSKNCAISPLVLLALAASSCSAPAQENARQAAPQGVSIFSKDVHDFVPYGLGQGNYQADFVPADGQPFAEALRLTTLKTTPNYWDFGVTAKLLAPVHRGDVLWVSLQLRCLESRRENGEAQTEIAFLQQVNGKEVRPLAREVSFGPKWTRFELPFLVQNDAELGQAKLGLRFGYSLQSFEVGDVTLLDYGPNVKLSDLPRTQVRYEGWAPDAPWRAAAQQRIEKYRKGDLTVNVVDGAGKPVRDAQVAVRMKRHAFGWGTAFEPEHILDSKDPDNLRYQQTLATYFNKVVYSNDLKWGRWIDPKYKSEALAVLPWLKAHDIDVRGHVLLWPSWQHLPASLFTDAVKSDPAAIRALVSDHITDEVGTLKGQLAEWDVANETYRHHDLLDILGRDALADWYRQTRAQDPKPKLFYNDYTMFQKGAGSDYFYNTVKALKESGAPIDAIGEQGHFASSPPGIPDVLATLDKFGTLGLPIQISEFDIDSDDPGLQADYMRDFTTAVFSHPAVMGVVQWGFWEGSHWLPRAALWDKNWNLRPHGQVWVDLVTKTWWTNADGKTDQAGSYKTRGFYGDYEVTATSGAHSRTEKFSLSPQNGDLKVVLP